MVRKGGEEGREGRRLLGRLFDLGGMRKSMRG
jgi:hypothetical protein